MVSTLQKGKTYMYSLNDHGLGSEIQLEVWNLRLVIGPCESCLTSVPQSPSLQTWDNQSTYLMKLLWRQPGFKAKLLHLLVVRPRKRHQLTCELWFFIAKPKSTRLGYCRVRWVNILTVLETGLTYRESSQSVSHFFFKMRRCINGS